MSTIAQQFGMTEALEILGVKAISANRVVAARKNGSNLTQWYYGTGGAWTSMATGAALGGAAKSATFNLNG